MSAKDVCGSHTSMTCLATEALIAADEALASDGASMRTLRLYAIARSLAALAGLSTRDITARIERCIEVL